MSIGKRLALLVLLAMLGLAGAGIFGTIKIYGLQSTFQDVSSRVLPLMRGLGHVSDSFRETRAVLLALLLEEDEDVRKGFAHKVTESVKRLNLSIDEVSRVPDAGPFAQTLRQATEPYAAAVSATVAVADKKDAAQVVLYTKVLPAEKVLSELLQANDQQMLKREKAMEADVDTETSRAATVFVLSVAAGFFVLGILGWLTHRSVMTPLTALEKALTRVATDMDFTTRVPVIRNDEIGKTVSAFNQLLGNVQGSLTEVAASTAALSSESSRLRETSQEMDRLSARTLDVASSVNASVATVSESIANVARQTEQAEELARESGVRADTGGQTVRATIDQIRAISEIVHSAASDIETLRTQVGSISSVVRVISEVADQTNLLALNAAIEAARAGEAGRGFAVVADEVRKLAERTALSTGQISQLIGEVQRSTGVAVSTMQSVVSQVEGGVKTANATNDALGAIGSSSAQVISVVSLIAESVRHQTEATARISEQFSDLSRHSTEISDATRLSTHTTQALDAQAKRLHEAIRRYRI
ncbi:methyl-accepting chemotaxis protein [Zoogloea sp.]|uniref:methyl-accepting chemotaxis protein n=1 Tax=Zoogloea sp. TaxID=49181 RepID=UPI00321FA4E4